MTREGVTYRKRRGVWLFGKFFGFEYSFIYTKGRPYLERWILYCIGTLRLHRFHDGDEPVFHDHPWWFITFPLQGYWETYIVDEPPFKFGYVKGRRYVKPFRFHWRSGRHQHYVEKPSRPVWTLVITGDVSRMWGFWPEPETFTPYDQWSKRIDS